MGQMTVFIMKQTTQLGSGLVGAFPSYQSILNYLKKHPGIKIKKDFIHGFDKYGDCGYMTMKQKRTYPDGTTDKVKYTITETLFFNEDGAMK